MQCDSSLRSVVLLQHDQIRDEVYAQEGVSLFIDCASASHYEVLIRQRALENLLIMSFNESVATAIKGNADFVATLKSLSENSAAADLQRASESLLWMLTKDDSAATPKTASTTDTYDIMISYSHKDKDLCFQIYDRLQQDQFRVWLDRDQMYGTPLEAMSGAIEKSEFVLLCMSDAYKQSGYCKMEATYALEQDRSIIPLVMKSQYRPDGWLGIIVTGRMRIDFPKYGFDDAYGKLRVELDRNRNEKKKTGHSQAHDIPASTSTTKKTERVEEKTPTKVSIQAKRYAERSRMKCAGITPCVYY